ncbi:MAG: hypothetical protein QNL16_04225 [Rhodobacterales bacterium]|jgi:hypothetical protein
MRNPLLVLFPAHSGSTALLGSLKQHLDLIRRAEVFGNKMQSELKELNADNRVYFLRNYWTAFKGRELLSADAQSKGFNLQLDRNAKQFDQPARCAKVASGYVPKVIANTKVLNPQPIQIDISKLRASLNGLKQDYRYLDRFASFFSRCS